MEKTTTYVGIDDHKDSLHLAVLRPDGKKAELLEIPHEPQAIRRLAGRLLKAAPGPVECCYEAGCNGFLLQRRLRSAGLGCQVVAPSLTPRRPGERIKTDRRDAVKLAEYLKAGLLAEVQPPSEAEEAARDLCRRREQVRRDLTQERQRLSRWLQRRGLRYGKKSRWTKHHRQWLWSLRPEQVADRYSLQDQLLSLDQLEFRRQELDRAIEALSQSDPYREPVGWLRCFRGVDTLTAMVLATELYNVARFSNPRQLMAYLGLVPGEYSSGARQRRGGITKAGNTYARRILIEAAWHARHRPAVSQVLRKRREGQPAEIIALADRAQVRLRKRYYHLLLDSKKPYNQAVTAVARELAGFVWAALQGPQALPAAA